MADLVYEKKNSTVIATLNRPAQLNALNKGIFESLKSMLDVLETDKSVRALVITGAGEKAFCVGADLKERQGMNEKDILNRMEFVHSLYLRMELLPFPVIAAINGICLGGGLELALTCDFRVASQSATVGFPEVDLAIIPGNGGTQRMARVVGMPKALEWIMLAKKGTAEEGLAAGFITRVVPNDSALDAALTLAHKLEGAGPIALRQAKLAIRSGYDKTIAEAVQWEVECYRACLYSKDRVEGLKAFSEKRKAEYRGE